MRKAVMGLMVVALLLCAGQAGAQNGTGDPLGLIASGAIQPFWSQGANFAVIEITSPVGDNSGPGSVPALHGIFFDASCVRQFSVPLPVTENGLLVFSPDDDLGVDYTGLLVIAGTLNQVSMVPAAAPFHVRSQWFNFGGDWVREIDPIAVRSAESTQTWSPLRSAASFASPLEDSVFHTEIFLVCPSPTTVLPVLPVSAGFPTAPNIAYAPTKSVALILGVVYDEDEAPQRNITLPCNCSSMFPVLDINSVYGNPASNLYYTELVTYTGGTPPLLPNTFTGYRSITVTAGGIWPGGTGDDFGRLNNGSAAAYLNLPFSPGLR